MKKMLLKLTLMKVLESTNLNDETKKAIEESVVMSYILGAASGVVITGIAIAILM